MKRDYFAVTYEEQNAQVPFPATQITPEKKPFKASYMEIYDESMKWKTQ